MTADVEIRGLTRSEYDLLVEAGMFADERLELLEGRLVRIGPSAPAMHTSSRCSPSC